MTCLFSFTNWLDRAGTGITASLSAASLGPSNLREPSLRARWRPLATNPALTVDLGQAREVGVFALAQPQDAGGIDADGDARGWMASTDTVRHRLSNVEAGGGEVLDVQGAGGWVPRYGIHVRVLSAPVSGRWWRCNLNAPTLAGLGFLDIGRAWLGPVWRPARNFAFGNVFSRPDSSRVQINPRSMLEAVEVGARQRVVRFDLASLDRDEAEAVLPDFLAAVGTRRQVLFVPYPDGPNSGRQAIIGRLVQVPAITHENFAFHSAAFELRETV